MLSAARPAFASRQAGLGGLPLDAIAVAVAGGTCPCAGRGIATPALQGIVVSQPRASGPTLLDPPSAFRCMLVRAVLAIAAIVGAPAGRFRPSHGRA